MVITTKVAGPPPENCVPQTISVLEPSSVLVNVYNGGSQRGLAGRTAEILRTAGFRVGTVSNTETRVLTILIIGAAADNPEVLLVAGWFLDAEIQADDRPDHSVDIILGDSFNEETDYAADPPKSIEIPSGEVCLPRPPSTPEDEPTGDETPVNPPSPTSVPS